MFLFEHECGILRALFFGELCLWSIHKLWLNTRNKKNVKKMVTAGEVASSPGQGDEFMF